MLISYVIAVPNHIESDHSTDSFGYVYPKESFGIMFFVETKQTACLDL